LVSNNLKKGEKCYEYNRYKSSSAINDNLKIQEERKMIREKMDILEIGPNYFEILATSDSWMLKDQYPGSVTHECIIDDEDRFQVTYN